MKSLFLLFPLLTLTQIDTTKKREKPLLMGTVDGKVRLEGSINATNWGPVDTSRTPKGYYKIKSKKSKS